MRFLLLLILHFPMAAWPQAEDLPPSNKLLYMFKLFYLPFDVEIRQGKTVDDFVVFYSSKKSETGVGRPLRVDEIQELDRAWTRLREPFKKKSLLLSTPLERNTSSHLTQRIVSHSISLGRGALDSLSLSERIEINEALRQKSIEVQENLKQLRFLQSLMKQGEETKFNFFIFSPSWCQSSKEYRFLFEHYYKSGEYPDLVLHSVLIDDPKEQIFESSLFKEIFPHKARYTHSNVPRFLALEYKEGKPIVYEEGDALKQIYERFLSTQKGSLSSQVKLFKK